MEVSNGVVGQTKLLVGRKSWTGEEWLHYIKNRDEVGWGVTLMA